MVQPVEEAQIQRSLEFQRGLFRIFRGGRESLQVSTERVARADFVHRQRDLPVHGRGVGDEGGKKRQGGIAVRVPANEPRKRNVDISEKPATAKHIQKIRHGQPPFSF